MLLQLHHLRQFEAGAVPREGRGDRNLRQLPDGGALHHQHAGGEEQRLLHVVGDEEDGPLVPLPLVQQPLLHGDPGEEVQGGEGLVQQQQVAARQHGAGKGRPLPHPARELVWHLAAAAGKSHVGQRRLRPVPALRTGQLPLDLQGQRHIFSHGSPGEQQVLLGHIAAVVLASHNGLPLHQNGPRLGL